MVLTAVATAVRSFKSQHSSLLAAATWSLFWKIQISLNRLHDPSRHPTTQHPNTPHARARTTHRQYTFFFSFEKKYSHVQRYTHAIHPNIHTFIYTYCEPRTNNGYC